MDLSETIINTHDEVHTPESWNYTAQHFAQFGSVHELFERSVQSNREQIAVTYFDSAINYTRLNQRANQLARLLRKYDVLNETLVGISVEKSIDCIVSMLGILKSGAVCVPLSPDYPDERINGMIKDGMIKLLITNRKHIKKHAGFIGKMIVLEDEEFSEFSNENLQLKIYPDSLAYVFFTSGSTGKPKGVQITHGAISNHMLWMKQKYFSFNKPIVLQKASCNFDASLWEIFLPLISQGHIVILPEEKAADLSFLTYLINKEKINAVELTPSMISLLFETKFFESPSLEWIFSSSEYLHTSIYNKFIEGKYKAKISVLYGPTEATIDATSYDCSKKLYSSNIPIGKPIANMQIYILDSELNIVPMGELGEIHIGGIGLARGYMDRALTAKKFIPNPFTTLEAGSAGTRLYKTGDLGRYLPDGNIEFLGRVDRQVKLRGFRIELEEIENVLLNHPEVQQVVVLFKERIASTGRPLFKYLVAYYKSKKRISEEQLVYYLQQRLPDYMVPNDFIQLKVFPINKNGKIDLYALPEPISSQYKDHYMAPRCEGESMLCEMWQKIFEIPRIGIEENFFHLGGNSLLCFSILNSILETFGVVLSPTDIYSGLTILNIYEIINKKIAENVLNGFGYTHTSLDELIAKEEEKLFDFNEIERIIETQYGRIWTQLVYTKESKENVPLILLHGGPSGSHDALRHLLPLCLHRPLLFFDQLGGGRSDTPPYSEISDFNIFVDALAAIVSSYDFESYYLFGDCLSCTVIIEYVATHKNKPKGIILSSPSISEELHDADLLTTSRRMSKKYRDIIDLHREHNIYHSPDLVEARNKFDDMFVLPFNKFTIYLKKSYLYIDPQFCERMAGKRGMFFPTEGTLQGVDVTSRLPDIDVPVLITFGENDFVTKNHKKLLKLIRTASIITFKNCAHWPLIEKTNEYVETLNRWFSAQI